MKYLLSLFLGLFVLISTAQDRTVSLNAMGAYDTYDSYTAVAADTLTANQDTLDVKFYYQGNYANKIAFKIKLDTIAGADTLTTSVLGYDFADDTGADATIAAATTNLAGETSVIISDDYSGGADEFSWRYYVVRLIRTGTGSGIKLEEIEFKVYP